MQFTFKGMFWLLLWTLYFGLWILLPTWLETMWTHKLDQVICSLAGSCSLHPVWVFWTQAAFVKVVQQDWNNPTSLLRQCILLSFFGYRACWSPLGAKGERQKASFLLPISHGLILAWKSTAVLSPDGNKVLVTASYSVSGLIFTYFSCRLPFGISR